MDKIKKVKNPKQKRSRERVELIFQSTVEVLKNDGIKALSTNSIAAQAGIAVSSIYQYFPNKQAILAALYEDYLKGIRDFYEKNNTPENQNLTWQVFFTQILVELHKLETSNRIDIELEKAMSLYPELIEIDRRHGDWMADRIATSMQQMGSRWPRAKLKRLAHYIYELNSATWNYRTQYQVLKKEALEWSITGILAIVGQCFD
tara:strand:+ start:709 stop:1320 length:612 start_codon:yes stop_codon:yes gene_type:complete